MGMPTATVKLKSPEGLESIMSAVGAGPVDAAFMAVDAVIGVPCTLSDYTVTSVTAGIESVATTRVRFVWPAGGGLSGRRRGCCWLSDESKR